MKSKNKNRTATVDCLGMGIIPLDLLFGVDRYPKAGEKIDSQSLTIQGGGPVPNVMIGLSRLGFKTSLIAAVGEDIFGKLGLDEIVREKVDVSHFVIKKQISAIAAGFVEQKTGQRTLVLERKNFVRPKDIVLSTLPLPKIIHLDGRDLDATIKLAKWGKKVGAIVSFDIGSIRNNVSPVFPYVDHLVVADSFAMPFTKTNTAKAAIKKLSTYGPTSVVVTEGIKGTIGFENGEFHKQPAFSVKTLDTTGAGDAFHTGYLYGVLSGFELSERLKWGVAVAALKCVKSGARAGLPKLSEVIKFLKSAPNTYA